MAKQVENAVTVVDLDGTNAKKELEKLQKQFKDLKKLQKELSADPIMNVAQLKQVDREIAGVRKELTKTKKETFDVSKVMNNLSGSTIRELEAAYRKVTAARKNMSRSDPRFKQLGVDQKKLKAEINKTNIAYKQQGSTLSKLASNFSKYSGIIMAGIASFAGIAFSVKKSIDAFLSLDEKMADVMKTTGMTKDEVIELNKQLAKLDTRTSQEELLDLARVAGKLGITAESEILGFVKAADQIAVALSEDLGGNIEDSVNQLGKLTEIFGIKEDFGIEKSLLKIGSTINSLGAIGTSNEGYMVEFSKRLGGIAPMAGISIDKVIGLGATLDELGQTAQVAGTSLTDVISSMFKDTAGFADIAGMSFDDFNSLLNKDANEAFLQVLEGAKGTSGGFQELANNLDALGLDGSRSIGVLGVLANNLDLVRERQSFASQEFEKGTSLTEEFNVKNNTATANLEKSKKQFLEMSVALGQKLQPAYAGVVSKASLLIKTLMAVIDVTIKYKNIIIPIVAAITTYVVAIKAAELWSKTLIFRTNLLRKAKVLYGNAVKVVTGKIKLAEIWQKKLNQAQKANIWVALAAVVVGATIALVKYLKSLNTHAQLQKEIADSIKQSNQELGEQKGELQSLLIIARDTTLALDDRKAAMDKINEISPEYLGNLTLEKLNTDGARQALVAYTAVLEQQSKIRAINNVLVAKETELYDAELNHLSQRTITGINSQLTEIKGDLEQANRDLERINREAEMASNAAGGVSKIGESELFGFPDGSTSIDVDGTPIIYKNGKWEAIVVPKQDDVTEPNQKKSNGNNADKENKELESEIWEIAQFQESMLIDAGKFYADYLLNRKNIDQSYYGWKKQLEIETNEELRLSNQEHNKTFFDEQMEFSKQAEDKLARELELNNAKGLMTDEVYQTEKINLIYASLLNELALRQTFGQDTLDIKQQIADAEFDIELNNQKKIQSEKQKALDDYKDKAYKYQDIAAEMGKAVGAIMGDTTKTIEERQKELAKAMLLMALQELRNMLTIAIASAMAKEVGTKGAIGLITGAVLTAALGASYGLAVSAIEGFKSGGHTGQGGSSEVAGIVHKKEYVIPEDGTSNPSLAKIINVIEAARVSNKLKSINFDTLAQIPNLQSGGYAAKTQQITQATNNDNSNMSLIMTQLANTNTKLNTTINSLSNKINNIEATISYDKQKIADNRITSAQSKARLSE